MVKMSEQKHLGLILDSKLSFEKHLNEETRTLELSNTFFTT